MPTLITRGAMSATGYGYGYNIPTYVQNVFSTYLYTGTSATLTITNNIDLSTKGGLVWIKQRSGSQDHTIFDTNRGVNNYLRSNSTGAQNPGGTYTDLLTAFNTTGFTLGADALTAGFVNASGTTYVSWSFRKQPKFFDIVTYTGSGANRTISHNLGSTPGCIIIKRTDTTAAWAVYHRSLANTQYLVLNTTAIAATGATYWNSTTPTSSVFSLGTSTDVNALNGTYVAYIFAHDSGGFGTTGTDNIISCGTFITDFSGIATITLGYQPQWLLIKAIDGTTRNWVMLDTVRGIPTGVSDKSLASNLSSAEVTSAANLVDVNSTGFTTGANGLTTTQQNFIYIAIRSNQ